VTPEATAFLVRRSRWHEALEGLPGEGPGRQLCRAHLCRDMQAIVDRGSGGESVGRRLLNSSTQTGKCLGT
jgi:hypothetical protein